MDTLLDLIAQLSRWSRGYLHEIALALLATVLVLFGPGFNAWVQQRIGGMNFVLRTLLFMLVCVLVYGVVMIFLPSWVVRGLDYFNNYTLAPVLLLVFFLIGVVADRQ